MAARYVKVRADVDRARRDDQRTVRALRLFLWPKEDPDRPWSPDTLETVALLVRRPAWAKKAGR